MSPPTQNKHKTLEQSSRHVLYQTSASKASTACNMHPVSGGLRTCIQYCDKGGMVASRIVPAHKWVWVWAYNNPKTLKPYLFETLRQIMSAGWSTSWKVKGRRPKSFKKIWFYGFKVFGHPATLILRRKTNVFEPKPYFSLSKTYVFEAKH